MADVNTLLDKHVTLRYESVDRLLLLLNGLRDSSSVTIVSYSCTI